MQANKSACARVHEISIQRRTLNLSMNVRT